MLVSRTLRARLLLGLAGIGLVAACQVPANAQNNKPKASSAEKRTAGSTTTGTTASPPPLPTTKKTELKPAPVNKANEHSPLGTNLDAINDWSSSFPFVDAMKRSREWISSTEGQWDDQRPFALDNSGWVRSLQKGQLARSLVFWDAGHYPSGDYVALYEGSADLTWDVQGGVSLKKPGREVVKVDSKGNLALLVSGIPKPASYPKNVRLIMPGGVCSNDVVRYCDDKTPCRSGGKCEPFEKNYATQIFHPKFLEKVAPFSTVRFMDWMKTNESKEQKWQDRPLPSDARFREGVPLEIMVALANRLSQNPWFNIPHAADDDYVRHFATYVRDNLRPELKAYVEYSNEVWNGMFPQAAYATEQGKKLKLGESNWDAQYRFYAKRTTAVHKIWESVFKGQQKRVVRVLAAQAANSGVAVAQLEYLDTRHHVDALAIAPYFGGEYGDPKEEKRWENASVTDVIDDLRKRSLPATFEMTKVHAEIAAKFNVELVAYEGGESFAGIAGTENNEKLNKLFDSVGRDPRIKEIYMEYLAGWKKNGGKLFVHFTDCFTPGKFGRWGALEYLEQPRASAPKYDGLLTFISQTPRWW
jgi:hypothetical protein